MRVLNEIAARAGRSNTERVTLHAWAAGAGDSHREQRMASAVAVVDVSAAFEAGVFGDEARWMAAASNGLREPPRRDPELARERTRQMALIGKAGFGRGIGDRQAAGKQRARQPRT